MTGILPLVKKIYLFYLDLKVDKTLLDFPHQQGLSW